MPHISYSELRNWSECTWRHKLIYLDKIDVFQGTEHTCYGTAVHDTVEHMLLGKDIEPYKHFNKVFDDELSRAGICEETQLTKEMRQQINGTFELVVPALDDYFSSKGGWSLVATEQELMEDINDSFKFKGFIDLILKDGQGHYHIIDWKTCSWGWNTRKKNDILYTRQLVLYKHFYAQKLDISPRAVSTHFGLIKRTAKKNRIELFRVTSGERKTKNSLDFLDKALYNITKGRHIKNKLSCKFCPFVSTEHCS